MRYIIVSLLFVNSLFAVEYYAKLEPINNYLIKSAVSGKVVFTNDKIEGFQSKNSVIVKIDSFVNKLELKYSLSKLDYFNKMIAIEHTNYKRLSKISSRSVYDKESQQLKVLNLKSQKNDLLIKISNLRYSIKNKLLGEKDTYIYNIAVKKGDYVNPGTILYEAKDLSRAKLEIFIPILDVETVKNKTIYLDGVASTLKIGKIYKVADKKHISSYKVEIIVPDIKTFSKLVKIEFK